jgi:hypothetical protein
MRDNNTSPERLTEFQQCIRMTTRATYLSHLRRAFLLRVHPDRFRMHPSETLRKNQASAIQALQERISAPDFISYCQNVDHHPSVYPVNKSEYKKIEYYLEQKCGRLQKFHLKLNEGVENILYSMEVALKSTGMKVMSRPMVEHNTIHSNFDMHYKNDPPYAPINDFQSAELERIRTTIRSAVGSNGINHSYDINTMKGRNLIQFLKNLDHEEIKRRRAYRIDASAAALVARQLYKFQAIDGTSLGWSSASLAKLLVSLASLHDEHGDKFVHSFYPLRLVLTNDEFRNKLDLYGGILRLNPQSTQIQWLETLVSITDDKLNELRSNRKVMDANLSTVTSRLNIRISKGYTCTSKDFFFCLQNLSEALLDGTTSGFDDKYTHALADEQIRVVVESPQNCRRSSVQREGILRVSSLMNAGDILTSIHTFRHETLRKALENKLLHEKIDQKKKQLIAKAGVTKVFRTKVSSLTTEQYLVGIEALLSLDLSGSEKWILENLRGQAIGVAGSGQSCQLYDDGSIILPYDWRQY